MAELPLPDRGQPLDVTYIYTMANTINQIASTVNLSTNKNIVVDTQSIGKQKLKNTDFAAIAGYTQATNATTVTTGQVVEVKNYSFGLTFKYPPIVTATVVANNNDNATTNATVVVSDISTTSVSFKVVFGTAGSASVGLNIIAIGVPSEYGNTVT
jgi:hypothetical protein